MRTLLIVLAVTLAFLLVRWTRPAVEAKPPVVAEGDRTHGAEEGARFLAPPSKPETPASIANDPTAKKAGLPTEKTGAGLEPRRGPSAELDLALAIARGTPADVQALAGKEPRARALVLEAFAWEMAGEHQMALEIADRVEEGAACSREERRLLDVALANGSDVPTSDGGAAVARAMESSLLARVGAWDLEQGRFPEAARAYSRLLLFEVLAPWRPDRRRLGDWTRALDVAQREHRWSPRGGWPSEDVRVEPGDSLIAIRLRFLAQHPDALLCTGMIERANRIRGFIQPGQRLRVPIDPVRVQVSLEARWAFYLLGDEVAAAWPVGIGRAGEETPPGVYSVRNKLEDPPWMKEGQEPIPFGDPRNPLGTRWIGWSAMDGAKTSYGFHGTWEPDSIGQAASDGCVRFLNPDIEELFRILPEGAPILVAP
jgi:hypothetical protein